tara:strand:+ start:12546 stop:18731 length:6186 start_codon:yes stop_codon:yes gene_type:complete
MGNGGIGDDEEGNNPFDTSGLDETDDPGDGQPCVNNEARKLECEEDGGVWDEFTCICIYADAPDINPGPGGGGGGPTGPGGPELPDKTYGIIGCMDPGAYNYNKAATHPCGEWQYVVGARLFGALADGTREIEPLLPTQESCCIYPDPDDFPGNPSGGDPGDIGYVEAKPSDCPDLDELPPEALPEQTCFPNQEAYVPNWVNQTEGEPFLNQRTCDYSIVMLADPPDCSQEYLNSFIPAAMDKLLAYYNKEETTTFINSTGGEFISSSRDALISGVVGYKREALTFTGTAEVKTFYISPRPLEKTKILITVRAEEFNRIPEKQEQFSQTSETAFGVEPSYVVFYTSEILRIFDTVAKNFKNYENDYADWSLQTGKIIKGLNLTADSNRLENFYRELSLLLGESDLTYTKLETIEIGFDSQYKIEYIKTKEPFRPPVVLSKGFESFAERPENQNATTMAYISRLPDINEDMRGRKPVGWYDILTKYRFPEMEEMYINDLTSPLVDGNDGIKKLSEASCPSAASAYEPKKSPGEWAKTQINSIRDALFDQLKEDPCLLVDGKILEQRNRESLAMQMIDLTLKEYLASDRIINDLPVLIANGRWDSIEDLYGGMLNNLGYCGIIDLIKSAIDCLLNALGYEDSIKIITRAAIKGMDHQNFAKFINSMSPAMQQIIVASVSELAPQVLPFLQSLVTVRIVDDEGVEIEAVGDRTLAYSYTSAGKYTRLGASSSPTASPTFFNQAANVDYPPPSAEDYATLNQVVVDLIMEDILGVEEIVSLLDRFPGASIAVSVLEKMDKFCAAPPRFYPPLSDILTLPGVNVDICQLQDGITFTQPTVQMPKLTLAGFGNIIIDNVLLVIKELARRLLILILRRILEIIFEELCKQRINTDPTGLRDLMLAGCSGDLDPVDLDNALADIANTLNCLADPEAVGRFVDNISSVLTECELVDVINGQASDNIYDLIYQIIQIDPLTAPLAECLNDKDSINDFFKSVAVFIDLDMLCTVDPLDLPFSQEVCDDLGLLALFRDTRAQALRDKGVDEECIVDQLCQLRDRTIADLEDLTDLLHTGVLDNLLPNIVKDPKNPDEPSLLPAIDPATSISMTSAFDSMYDALTVQYTDDLIGRRGFLNMCLADSRGRGLAQHLGFQRSILGPSVFNIYGSRATRAHPPRDEWAAGADTPEDHNEWVQGPIKYTDDAAKFFWLPFLFNPLSADGSQPDAEDDEDIREERGATETKGRPPAVGGLPDKVAGYLQETLNTLPVSFSKSNPYSVILPWQDYNEEEGFAINVFYDYHAPNPEDNYPEGRSSYDYDSYRVKVEMSMDYDGSGAVTDTKTFFVGEDPVPEDVSAYMRDFVVDGSGNVNTPADMWGTFIEGIFKEVSETPGLIGNSLYDRYSSGGFNYINEGFLRKLAEDISKVDIFDYGFDQDSIPEVIYFHEDPDLELDLAAAIEKYGGSEANPPFYIREPEESGFLRIANSIVPEFNACEDTEANAKFPNFYELKEVAGNLVDKISDDERLSRAAGDVINIIEAPFERVLPAAAVALNESLIYTTIRIYLSEFMLKSLPVFYFLRPKYPDNYTNLVSEYIIEMMEEGLINSGRGRRYREDYKDYYYLFLEQVVQCFTSKIEYKILTDVSETESQALRNIYSFIENNWAGYVSPRNRKLKDVREEKLENWRGMMSQTSIINNCKTILRRYVGEEITRMASILNESLPTKVPYPVDTIDDLLITSPNRIPAEIPIPGGSSIVTDIPYIAGAVNNKSDNGPVDVPTIGYYTTYGLAGGLPHPLDSLSFDARNWPFVLERYVSYRGSEVVHPYGSVANLFDWQDSFAGENYNVFNNELYFGLRLSYVPTQADRNSVSFDSISDTIDDNVAFSSKAFAEQFKHLIPIASVEVQVNKHIGGTHSDSYSPQHYQDYLQDLICLLIETPEYKMTFKHVFPLARYMSLYAVYVSNAFVPSLANVSDGWAAKSDGSGGGRWIGFGKNGGMNTWRGNEGASNSFHKSKEVARQLLESSCNTNYFYKDRNQLTPPEAFVDISRPKNDTGLKLKWWQWGSLRPPPCKEDE